MPNPLAVLLAYVAPYVCIVCHSEGALLCTGCRSLLPPAPALNSPYLETMQAVTVYEQPVVKQLLWKLKSDRAAAVATEIAHMMVPLLRTLPTNTVITFAPTAAARVRLRGYDQAQLIAKHASRLVALPCLRLLIRESKSRQVGSSRMERQLQAKSLFSVKDFATVPEVVCIIDDVFTTGATLEAAAIALKRAGTKKVFAVVFAAA